MTAALAAVRAPAAAAQVIHERGVVLGTTPAGLDIGIPGRLDIHLQMAFAPRVAIAASAALRDVLPNARVSVGMRGRGHAARAFTIFVVPDSVHAFDDGVRPWDFPGGNGTLVTGRIVRRVDHNGALDLTVDYAGGRSRFNVSAGVRVIALRAATRDALISAQNAFVFARPPAGGLSDVVDYVIVADGDLGLPL